VTSLSGLHTSGHEGRLRGLRPHDAHVPALTRRQILRLAAAAALPWGASSCSSAPSADAPLQVGGLPVTCNLTLPVACTAKEETNRAAPPGAPRFRYEYSKYSGWPEIKESLMAGRIQAGYMLAPLVMDLADKKIPVKIVSLGHRSGAVIMVRTESPVQHFQQLALTLKVDLHMVAKN
jgi:NitT/TauT family transport system substrate-binding protein